MTEVDSHIPDFTLEEKEEEIVIVIVAPLSKPGDAAFVLERDVFTFESPPYLLKIKLPHFVLDRFSQQAYDKDTKTYKIKLKKNFEYQQDYIQDEEEISDPLICPKGEITVKCRENKGNQQFYGFANKYSKMFGKLYEEFSEVINLPNPDLTTVSERRNLRIKEEIEKWNDDHYLADNMETDHLESIFKYEPPWIATPLKDNLNAYEKDILFELADDSKIVGLSQKNIRLSEFQIIDVLFGYSYNKRTTEGDNTVESGWTINKLSSTLSWFEVFEDLKSVLLACYRRSLIFPLFRNWNLTKLVHKDVTNILKIGPKQITQCLFEVREIFNESDNRYILNSLYINDLSLFSYHMTSERCLELSEEVSKITIKKCEVNSDLPLLEVAAHLTLEEETEGSVNPELNITKIINKIAGLNIESESSASNCCSESDSDSEESESSESSDTEKGVFSSHLLRTLN